MFHRYRLPSRVTLLLKKSNNNFMASLLVSPDYDHWFSTDQAFDSLYPAAMRKLSRRHWTPLYITESILDFLVPENGVSVLDIGSGIGKFCIAAGYYRPNAFFTGIEQRKGLVNYAENALSGIALPNVQFIH